MKLRVLDECLQWWSGSDEIETHWDDWVAQVTSLGVLDVFLDLTGECLSGSEWVWEESDKIDALLTDLMAQGFRLRRVVSAQSLLTCERAGRYGLTYSLGYLNRCCLYQDGVMLQSFIYKNEAQKLTYLQQMSTDMSVLECPLESVDMQALILGEQDLSRGYGYHSSQWARLKKKQNWHRVQSYLAVLILLGIFSVWVGLFVFQEKVVTSYKKIPSEVREQLTESRSELNQRKAYEHFLEQASLSQMSECWLLLSQNIQRHPNVELNFIHLKENRWVAKGQVKGFQHYADAEEALDSWLRSVAGDSFKVEKEVHYAEAQVLAFKVEFDGHHSEPDALVCLAAMERSSEKS